MGAAAVLNGALTVIRWLDGQGKDGLAGEIFNQARIEGRDVSAVEVQTAIDTAQNDIDDLSAAIDDAENDSDAADTTDDAD